MPNSRTSSKRSTVRSMTARSDDIALAEFRRELAKVAIMNREREERLRRKQRQRQSYLEEEEKILNDLDAPHTPSSDSTSDNNPSFREEELCKTGTITAEERSSRGAQIPEPSSKRSSGTCSCSNSSCSCSCCSDAWWLNQNEPAPGDGPSKGALSTVEEIEGDAQVPRGERPDPEGEEMKMDESSTSSVSSGYMEEWRKEGRRKNRAMTMTSTTTSSSAGGATTGWSSYKPESDEWVFVVSSSLSSAPEPEIWLAKEGVGVVRGKIETIAEEELKRGIKKEDSLGYGTLPPSESDLVLRKAEMIKQNEKNDEKNKNKSKDPEETVIIKAEKKKRGIAYFRKKISKKDKEDKKKKKEEILAATTTDNDKIKELQKMENANEAPPSPAPQPIPAHPGKGKVAAEVARINENAKREVQNFLEPINLARLKNENRSRVSSAIIRERTSSLGRNFGRRPPLGKYEPRVLPDRAAMTSPEVTPKRSARKQQMMRERAMQIEVERSQLTTDEEDDEEMNLDPEDSWMAKVRGQMRRRRRSRTFSGERRRVGSFASQTPGIGQLLMVQAEFGQKSQLVRDNIHITAV